MKKNSRTSIDEALICLESKLFTAREQTKTLQQCIDGLRYERAKIYEQQAAKDTEVAQKFDGHKTPSPIHQASYDQKKQQ